MSTSYPTRICRDKKAINPAPLRSVEGLCIALRSAAIRFCHWKSNNTLDESLSGDKDLDLLIARSDACAFSEVLAKCGYKLIHAPADKEIPGVQNYLGYDADADQWVHVHAHYQLIVGHDLSKNHRLAIEQAYLESARTWRVLPVPAPEFEYIVFVIRMILKHSHWYTVWRDGGRLRATERQELIYLQAQVEHELADDILEEHLSYIKKGLFWRCVDALANTSSVWSRMRSGWQLRRSLRECTRRTPVSECAVIVCRRVVAAIRQRILHQPVKYRPGTGGISIAVVGGDGAGKSTAIEGIRRWLSPYFATTCAHLGKPAWSPTTILLRSVLRIGNTLGLYGTETSIHETLGERSWVSPGYAWLIREVCRARDRYWTYVRARRRAADDGIVIFDRFPLDQVRAMDGAATSRFVLELTSMRSASTFLQPRVESWAVQYLIRLEESYYRKITLPELLVVLRVRPDTAVQRKPEDREYEVRERSAEIWELSWQHEGIYVVDAEQSKDEVLSEIKSLIWPML